MCSLSVGWLTASFSAIRTPQTPSSTRSAVHLLAEMGARVFNQSRIRQAAVRFRAP